MINNILRLDPQASQGDVGLAVGLLTSQPPEVQDPGDPQESKTSAETWESQKGKAGTKSFGRSHNFVLTIFLSFLLSKIITTK